MPAPQRVFYSYASKDANYCAKLRSHLALAENLGVIISWYDRQILPGTDWATEIDDHMENSEIILLLVSSYFIQSTYCWGREMERALAKHNAGEALVIPVYIKPVDFAGAPFARLQMLPSNGRPVSMWGPQDAGWEDVAKGVRRVAEVLQKNLWIPRPMSGPVVLPSQASAPLQQAGQVL